MEKGKQESGLNGGGSLQRAPSYSLHNGKEWPVMHYRFHKA